MTRTRHFLGFCLRCLRSRVIWALLIVLATVVGGATALNAAGEPWELAFYRAFMTISTAGIVDEPRTSEERLVASALVVFGVSFYVAAVGLVVEAVGRRLLGVNWRERRERTRLERLEGHHLLCGYGRVGRSAAAELKRANVPYVVVELDGRNLQLARERGELVVEGDATDIEVLEAAGLKRACGLIAVMDTDAENLYTVLLAHEANPALLVAARASTDEAARKLRAAGADRIVSPYEAAGRKLAAMAANPHVENFVDLSAYANADLKLAQVEVEAGSWADGRALSEIREETGAKPVALWHGADEGAELDLDPSRRLRAGDVLIAVGPQAAVAALEGRFRP